MRSIRVSLCLAIILLFFYQPSIFANEEEIESRSVLESLNPEQGNETEQTPNEREDLPLVGNESESDASETEAFAEQNAFMIFAQMIGALGFVIFLLYALLRFINKRSRMFRSTQVLQNIGGVPLGANRSVQLVKVGNRVLVVGVGETIQLLKEIDNEVEINELINQQEEQFAQIDVPINKVMAWVTSRLKGTDYKKSEHSLPNQANQQAFKELLSKQLSDVSKSQKQIHEAVRREKNDN
ncbi:flagellar biosynthetic protein FliO [Bacillus solitudinis]|uniref:flagellar biosynthetic protein FliO n=1 Tax=Bacillus solitudinis TaxID=2014074 RepID=UPI001D0D4E46|nr:flagellar biosynthetic protein FliO [Bacillus solitudinis]